MSYESEYVKERREKELKQYNDEMALRAFRQKYKPQIENQGLTEQEFRNSHRYTDSDLQMFRQIEQEVKEEKALGEAFLAGFNSGGRYGL